MPTPPVPRAELTLKKPNEAIVMLPKLGKLTATARKIYNVILHATQRQVQDHDALGKTIEATHLFSARLEDVVEPVQSEGSDIRTMAKKYLREMRRVEVDWEAPDSRSGVVWSSMGLLSQVQIEIVKGVAHVKWALPPDLLSAVRDPVRFTMLDIRQMARLHGYTAVALYEICARYRTNPSGVTALNPPEWWVEALTNAPAAIDPATGAKRLREWRKVKSESVLRAIEEINELTDIEIELIEHKTGKAITAVQFAVRRKAQAVLPASGDVAPRIPADLAEHATRLQIGLRDMASLLAARHSPEVLRAALMKLEQRVLREDLEPVGSRLAYLRAVVDELDSLVTRPGRPSSAPTPATSVLAQASAFPQAPSRDQDSVEPDFKERRRAEIRQEMESLPAIERLALQARTVEELRRRVGLTPAMVRKIDAGDFHSGVLASTMFEVFATDRHGPNWASAD